MAVSRGAVLVLTGVVLLSTTLVASAVTAPSQTVEGPSSSGGVAADATATPPPSAGTPTIATGTARQTRSPTPAETATETSDATTGAETGSGTVQSTATATATATATPTATPTPRKVLIGIQGGGQKWQKKGSVNFVSGQSVVWSLNNSDSYFDVTRLDNGSVLVGFMHGGYEEGCAPYDPPCTKTGYRIIDPEPEPHVVSEWSFPVRHPANSEVHDVEPLGDGRFLMTDMEYERIMIVQDGDITWQWNASSFYDAPPDPTKRDWLHINDVDVIGDGRYMISVRNANQLLIIQRGEGVVDVINEDRSDDNDANCKQRSQLKDFNGDGDVRCGNPDLLNHQHNPQWLGDGAVLVADSDNNRIVELHETDDGRWQPVWTLTEANGLSLFWPRDADRLPNGNTLVTDSLHRRVFEVTQSGEVVWSKPTRLIPYEADTVPAGEFAGSYSPPTTSAPTTASDGETAAPESTTATDETTGNGDTDDSDGSTAADPATGTATTSGSSSDSSGSAVTYGSVDDGTGASSSSSTAETGNEVPVLTTLLVGIRAVVPRLPFWFGETQLALTLLSLGTVVGGVVDYVRP